MTRKITLNVLAEKIDSIHDSLMEIKNDVKENTKFRLQAKGFIGAVVTISGLVGGFVFWLLNKIWK